MIRKATFDDYAKLQPMFDAIHQRTPFKNTPFDEEHMLRTFILAISMPVFFCKVSVDKNNKPQGFFAGGIDKNIWGIKIASDILVVAGRDTDLLIKDFIKWADENQASEVVLTEISNNPRYKALIKKCGLSRIGTVYSKELNHGRSSSTISR